MTPVTVDIWSDVVCPWCYLGKRRFEHALDQIDFPVEVRFHAFQLDPSVAPGTDQPMLDTLAQRFGDVDKVKASWERLTALGHDVGIDYEFERTRTANTLLAHRLIWLADQPGSPTAQAAMKERLMKAYFTDGAQIGDPDVLAGIAAELGFDREHTREWLATDEGLAEVHADIAQAGAYGITAVPTFVIEGQWGISGAQETWTITDALRQIHAQLTGGTTG